MKRLSLFCFVGLFGSMLAAQFTSADEPATLILLQDEFLQLPDSSRGYFAADRQMTFQTDMLAVLDDLGDTRVTLIRPNGEKTDLEPDSTQLVTFDNVEAGPHVLVASSRQSHGTMFINLQPVPEPDAAADEPAAAEAPADGKPAAADQPATRLVASTPEMPKRLTMMSVRAKQLRPVIEELREIEVDESMELEIPDVEADPFDYEVLLVANGTLQGRVLSTVSDASNLSVANTRITIYLDGKPIGSTTCDEAGVWSIKNMRPGVFGLIASGKAGYTAFAFKSIDATELVLRNNRGERFTSQFQAPADQPQIDQPQNDQPQGDQPQGEVGDPFQDRIPERLPVVLCPPPFIPEVVESIVDYYPTLKDREGIPMATTGEPIAVPAGGSMFGGSPVSSVGQGGGVASAGASGGGVGLAAGAAGLAAILAATDSDSGKFGQTIASPAFPLPTPSP